MNKSRKRQFSAQEVLRKLHESDDESFDDSDDDRDSNYVMSDDEPVDECEDGADSDATEFYDPPLAQGPTAMSEDESDDGECVPLPAPSASSTAPNQGTADRPTWEPVDENYSPNVGFTFTAKPGMTCDSLTVDSSPVDFFRCFLTDEVVAILVAETNRFAEQFLASTTLTRKSRAQKWMETDSTEMQKFLGMLLMMGIVKKPRIQDYWSTDPVLATPVFNKIMSRDRFELLLKFWHFCNNEEQVEGDRLFKLRAILEALVSRFQAAYVPGKELSIDESMVLWRGRLLFRQYIPGKRHKYGVKLYLLCESSGYVWNMLVYCGKSDPMSGLGHAESVVMKLMEKILDQGYSLYVDNFYTSVPLAKALLTRKTLLCGTLRRNRKHLPETVTSAKLQTGQHIVRHQGNIIVLKWKDKRDVMMLSTHHAGLMMDSHKKNRRGQLVRKPDCIIDYNKFMCGVDRMDQLLSYYTPLRKSLKWYRKVVLQVIDMSLSNAYLLYKKLGGTKRQLWFRANVIRSLIGSQDRPATAAPSVAFKHHKASDLSRLGGQHYLNLIPSTATKATPCRKCVVCKKHGMRKETRYFCEVCPSQPSLCVVSCFKQFHTERDF